MAIQEQKFLIDNGFDDLVLNESTVKYHGDKRGYKYVSDVMEMYLKASRESAYNNGLAVRRTRNILSRILVRLSQIASNIKQ